jgi:hypothetical protein
MRDVHLRFGIDRGTCQRSHLSLVFCECLQVIIHKGDVGLAYEISPIYRGSLRGNELTDKERIHEQSTWDH